MRTKFRDSVGYRELIFFLILAKKISPKFDFF